MLTKLYTYIRSLLKRGPMRLAVVRRYADANGAYVGELYLWRERFGIGAYEMIGASLDSLPLDSSGSDVRWVLDTQNDFLAALPPNCVRVGGFQPQDDRQARAMVKRLAQWRRVKLVVQNRFIERVLEDKKI